MRLHVIKLYSHMDSARYTEVCSILVHMFSELKLPEPKSGYNSYDLPAIIATDAQVVDLREAGVEFTLSGRHTLNFPELAKEATTAVPQNSYFNQRVNVHATNGALLFYNETLLLENSCTDRLQEHLNEGWRIIAVCVQPDQRRPDYILGRHNPTFGA